MENTYKEILPDPTRVIEGLRDTGYQIESAIEDIIDNSIAAEATHIDLQIEMDYLGNIGVFIADNGYGMNPEELEDAMRYGSKERSNPASLGKFGLGLKTASTAFCRKLSLVSSADGAYFSKATWDLDHVAQVRKWELILSEPKPHEIQLIEKIAGNGAGTLVCWENVDRLLKTYAEPGGAHARKAMDAMICNLKDHTAMVYQRFLDPNDSRDRNIELRINGSKVESWNPFCPNESEIVAEEVKEVEFTNGNNAEFTIRAHILPRKEEFTSPEAQKESRLGNDTQGIYVYRENRLIYGPDWLKMYSKEPHYTLLRVEFSFDHKLDDAFHIDIKKSQIILNEELRKWLKDEFLPVTRRAAQQRYRIGLKKSNKNASKKMHDTSNTNIRNKEDDLTEVEVKVIDRDKNEVELTNKHGSNRLKIKISEKQKPGETYVKPVQSIEDGLLWEPTIIETDKGVSINTGHDYYSKVYIPNKKSNVIIEGLDSLLWALSMAELETLNEKNQKYFKEMRYGVSRILRTLVEDLPEPVDDDDDDDEQ